MEWGNYLLRRYLYHNCIIYYFEINYLLIWNYLLKITNILVHGQSTDTAGVLSFYFRIQMLMMPIWKYESWVCIFTESCCWTLIFKRNSQFMVPASISSLIFRDNSSQEGQGILSILKIKPLGILIKGE